MSSVVGSRTLAKVRRCPTKAELAAARIEWTCRSRIFGILPTLRYGVTVRQTTGAAVSRAIATIATATTTSTITARVIGIAFILVASM